MLSFKNMVEHVGHVIVGLSMYAPGSICFLQSMQVYVQINSLIATMKVSKETTLDLGSGCCVEATVISSFSVVMTVSKLDVTLSWLLKVDNTTFCRLRTSPLPILCFLLVLSTKQVQCALYCLPDKWFSLSCCRGMCRPRLDPQYLLLLLSG